MRKTLREYIEIGGNPILKSKPKANENPRLKVLFLDEIFDKDPRENCPECGSDGIEKAEGRKNAYYCEDCDLKYAFEGERDPLEDFERRNSSYVIDYSLLWPGGMIL